MSVKWGSTLRYFSDSWRIVDAAIVNCQSSYISLFFFYNLMVLLLLDSNMPLSSVRNIIRVTNRSTRSAFFPDTPPRFFNSSLSSTTFQVEYTVADGGKRSQTKLVLVKYSTLARQQQSFTNFDTSGSPLVPSAKSFAGGTPFAIHQYLIQRSETKFKWGPDE